MAPWADVIYACDARWWRVYGAEAADNTGSELWASYSQQDSEWQRVPARVLGKLNWIEVLDDGDKGPFGLSLRPGRIHGGLNSGYQALGLAYEWGCVVDILLGYDMQRTGGKSHHHGDHEGKLPNLGTLPEWSRRMIQMGIDLRERGVLVINATRTTAITCFERMPIKDALNVRMAEVA